MKKKFSEIVKILAAILTFILLISLVYHFSGGKQNSQEKYQEENLLEEKKLNIQLIPANLLQPLCPLVLRIL
jgi:hypothetical protein